MVELKEISELAKFLTNEESCGDCCACVFGGVCYERLTAERLCNEGWRKRIKAEWKSGTKNGQFGYYCTNCEAGFTGENAEWIAKEHDYCPKCGAMMKGGAG